MRFQAAVLGIVLAVLTTASFAQPKTADAPAPDLTSITGIWRCDMHDLPAVTLTITDEEGTLNGAVLFYLHKSGNGQPETATPGVPEPLFHPSFDGHALTFEVSHRRAHPPSSLSDPPITFALKLDGPGKAELVNESNNDPKAPRYIFTRSAY